VSILLNVIQPLQGWLFGGRTQGRPCWANPGLYDHNPFRVAEPNETGIGRNDRSRAWKLFEKVEAKTDARHHRQGTDEDDSAGRDAQIRKEQSDEEKREDRVPGDIGQERMGDLNGSYETHIEGISNAEGHDSRDKKIGQKVKHRFTQCAEGSHRYPCSIDQINYV
jgi:plastocyanin